MPDVRLAVQLYTMRNAGLSFDGMLEAVTDAAYGGVETVGAHGLSSAELRQALARHGLRACSSHVPWVELRDDLEATLAFYREAGIDTLVVPMLKEVDRPGDAGEWVERGARMGRLAERCSEQGVSLLYHNHDFELATVGNDAALAHLMRASAPLGLELDLGWAIRAGADPHTLLARYAGRVPQVHVKDVAADDLGEGGWADVGFGTVAWEPLLAAAQRAGATWWIVEHDEPRDPVASIRRSAAYLRSLVEAV